MIHLIFLLFISNSFSQKVIVKNFKWQLYPSKHFNIYFYKSSENIISDVIQFLENAYNLITQNLDVEIKDKTPFFLYSNHNDFEQTNITDVGEGTGGVTEAFKNRFVVFNSGSKSWLEQVIRHEFVHVAEFNALYGGFWKSLRLLKFIFYPNWFMEGLAEYFTGDIDKSTREMYLRDAATSGNLIPIPKLHGFNYLKPHQITLAYKESEKFMRFLVEEYGQSKLRQLLFAFREGFDTNSIIQSVVGLDLITLDKKFQEEMEDYYKYFVRMNKLNEPEFYGKILTKPDQWPQFNTSPVFYQNSKIVYLSDKSGVEEVVIGDLNTNKTTTIISKNYDDFDRISSDERSIAISPQGDFLVFVGEKNQQDYLYIYYFKNKKIKKLKKLKFEQIKNPIVSTDGSQIVFSAMKNSFTDIYSYNLKTKKLENLTNDENDDLYPSFSPDGSSIVYSKEVKTHYKEPTYQRNLYLYSFQTKKSEQLTNLPFNEIQPFFIDEQKILFVSDCDRIFDIYYLQLPEQKLFRLTRSIGGSFNPVVSPDKQKIIWTSFRRIQKHIYITDFESLISQSEEIQLESVPEVEKISKKTQPLNLSEIKYYRFPKFSTDLFFPIIYGSTLEGIVSMVYWTSSDLLGNHRFETNISYNSKYQEHRITLSYSYLRFRPQFSFAVESLREVDIYDNKQTYLSPSLTVNFPIDRYNFLIFRVRNQSNTKQIETKMENTLGFFFIRDTSTGRYLEVNKGWRLIVGSEKSKKEWRSDYEYTNNIFESSSFYPFKNNIFAFRILYADSYGENHYIYTSGGIFPLRVRGYSAISEENWARRILIFNTEFRILWKEDINYHMWYMFPDLFFKSSYIVPFFDIGTNFSDLEDLNSLELKSSFGVALRFHTFILQTFPLVLSVEWAKKTTDRGNVFYINLGSGF